MHFINNTNNKYFLCVLRGVSAYIGIDFANDNKLHFQNMARNTFTLELNLFEYNRCPIIVMITNILRCYF